jgi:putative endonuclease
MTKSPPKSRGSFFAYVLASRRKSDRRRYVGWTTDLKRRFRQHNAGLGAKATRDRKWFLLYSECRKTGNEAMRQEWHLKRDRKFLVPLRAGLNFILQTAGAAKARPKPAHTVCAGNFP